MKRILAMAAVAALIGAPVLAQDAGQGADQGTMGSDQAMPSDTAPATGAAATPDAGPAGPAASDERAPGSSDESTAPAPGQQSPAMPEEGASGTSGATDQGAATEAKPMHHRRHARRHQGHGMEAAGSGNDEVKALNNLAAQGYRPTGQMTRQGGEYVVPVTKDGQSSTVTVDPRSDQISTQEGGHS